MSFRGDSDFYDNDIADRLDIELWELSEAIEFYKTKGLL